MLRYIRLTEVMFKCMELCCIMTAYSEYTCPRGTTKCPGGLQCVATGTLCDGIEECNDGSDESVDLCEGLQLLHNLTKIVGEISP